MRALSGPNCHGMNAQEQSKLKLQAALKGPRILTPLRPCGDCETAGICISKMPNLPNPNRGLGAL